MEPSAWLEVITAHKGGSKCIYKHHLLCHPRPARYLHTVVCSPVDPLAVLRLRGLLGKRNYQYVAKLEWIREELEDGGIALCRRVINGDKPPHPSCYPFSLMTRLHNTTTTTTAAAASCEDCWRGDGEDLLCCTGEAWPAGSSAVDHLLTGFTFTNHLRSHK